MTDEDLFRKSSFKDASFRSLENKYLIIDNLDVHGEPIIRACQEFYNTQYTFSFVVLQGNLHLIVNDRLIDVKANENLVVTPFMRVEILDSRSIFFAIFIQSEIANDIYEQSGIGKNVGIRFFCYYHFHFEKPCIDLLLNDYQLIRVELGRDGYKMKEMTLRSLITVFLAHMQYFRNERKTIPHGSQTRQQELFSRFLNLLDSYYKQYRTVQFYADKLSISPKYLSNIVHTQTGFSASAVIDRYVVYRIKQALYANDINIKTISAMFNFPNQSFFGRYFKRIVGISPNDYLRTNNRRALSEGTNT